MSRGGPKTRRRSAALFGNEKVAEVLLSLHAQRPVARLTDIAADTGIANPMVRTVLVRLLDAGVLTTLPRRGGSRGELFYEVADEQLFAGLLTAASCLVTEDAHQPVHG